MSEPAVVEQPDAASARLALSGLADYINGRAFKQHELGPRGVPVIRIKQLTDPAAEVDFFDGQVDPKHLIDDGDVIFSWSGSLNVVRWRRGPAALNQHLFKVVPKAGTHREWLAFALEAALRELESLTHGTTMKHITRKTLDAVSIERPALQQQERVADLFEAFDAAIRLAEAATASSTELFWAIAQERISAISPDRVELGRLINGIVGGKSPRCHDRPPESDEWGVLKLSAVQPLAFQEAEAKALPADVTPDATWPVVQRGDVLMTRSNTPERVGLATYVESCSGQLLLSDLIWKLIPGPALEPRYLSYVLSISETRRAITSAASGTSASMKKLNHAKVRALRVPTASRARQAEVADLLDAMRDVVNLQQGELVALRAAKRAALNAVYYGHHEVPKEYDIVRLDPASAVR
jgi:type I restriction enzyme S subunit